MYSLYRPGRQRPVIVRLFLWPCPQLRPAENLMGAGPVCFFGGGGGGWGG
jgi:hypothetical protein